MAMVPGESQHSPGCFVTVYRVCRVVSELRVLEVVDDAVYSGMLAGLTSEFETAIGMVDFEALEEYYCCKLYWNAVLHGGSNAPKRLKRTPAKRKAPATSE